MTKIVAIIFKTQFSLSSFVFKYLSIRLTDNSPLEQGSED